MLVLQPRKQLLFLHESWLMTLNTARALALSLPISSYPVIVVLNLHLLTHPIRYFWADDPCSRLRLFKSVRNNEWVVKVTDEVTADGGWARQSYYIVPIIGWFQRAPRSFILRSAGQQFLYKFNSIQSTERHSTIAGELDDLVETDKFAIVAANLFFVWTKTLLATIKGKITINVFLSETCKEKSFWIGVESAYRFSHVFTETKK